MHIIHLADAAIGALKEGLNALRRRPGLDDPKQLFAAVVGRFGATSHTLLALPLTMRDRPALRLGLRLSLRRAWDWL